MPQQFREQHRDRRNRYLDKPTTIPLGSLLVTAQHMDGHNFLVQVGLHPAVMGDRKCVLARVEEVKVPERGEPASGYPLAIAAPPDEPGGSIP